MRDSRNDSVALMSPSTNLSSSSSSSSLTSIGSISKSPQKFPFEVHHQHQQEEEEEEERRSSSTNKQHCNRYYEEDNQCSNREDVEVIAVDIGSSSSYPSSPSHHIISMTSLSSSNSDEHIDHSPSSPSSTTSTTLTTTNTTATHTNTNTNIHTHTDTVTTNDEDEDEVVRRAREIALNASKILHSKSTQEHQRQQLLQARLASTTNKPMTNAAVAVQTYIAETRRTRCEDMELRTLPDPKQRRLVEEAVAGKAGLGGGLGGRDVPLVDRIGIGKAKEKFEALKAGLQSAAAAVAVSSGSGSGGGGGGANASGGAGTGTGTGGGLGGTGTESWEAASLENGSSRSMASVPRSLPGSPKRTISENMQHSVWDDNEPRCGEITVSILGGNNNNNNSGVRDDSNRSSDTPSSQIPTTTATTSNPIHNSILVTQPTLSTVVWKKRNGMGKYSIHNAWIKRRLELVGTKLVYYKLDTLNTPLPNTTTTSPPSPSPLSPSFVKSISTSTSPSTNSVSGTSQPQPLSPHGTSSPNVHTSEHNSHPTQPTQPTTNTTTTKPKKDLRQLWEQASAHLITKAHENLSKLDPNHNNPHDTKNSCGTLDLIQENATVSPLADCYVPSSEPTHHSSVGGSLGSGGASSSYTTGGGIGGGSSGIGSNTISTNTSTTLPSLTSTMTANMNLTAVTSMMSTSFHHPPTPYGLAIVVKSGTEPKWKVCFENQREQIRWLSAITDIVVGRSVDCYNEGLLDGCVSVGDSGSVGEQGSVGGGGGGGGQGFLGTLDSLSHSHESNDDNRGTGEEVKDQSVGDDKRNLSKDPLVSDTMKEHVWKKEIFLTNMFRVKNGSEHQVDNKANATASGSVGNVMVDMVEGGTEVEDGDLDDGASNVGPCLMFRGRQLYYACAVVNVSLCLGHLSSSSPQMFWFLIVFINVFGLMFVEEYGNVNRSGPTAAKVLSKSQRNEKNKASGKKKIEGSKSSNKKVSNTKLPKNGFKPVAGSSTVRVTSPEMNPFVNGRQFIRWMPIRNDQVKVRSYGYSATKKKVSTPQPLYRLVGVEALFSDRRIKQIGNKVTLPSTSFDDDGAPKTWKSPDNFIVSIAIPTEQPVMGKPTDDGHGFTVTAYYVMTPETRRTLRRVTAAGYDPSMDDAEVDKEVQSRTTNSVRLWEEWCTRAPMDSDWQARFKFVPNIHNPKDCGLPSYICRYSGKPVLIKRRGITGFLTSHPKLNAMEFMVSVHPFPYLVKKATAYMKDNIFHKALSSFSYVIEGRCDNELPEAVIGEGAMLCYPHPDIALHSNAFFGGTAVSSVQNEGKDENNEHETR